jgi:hypothetical protein
VAFKMLRSTVPLIRERHAHDPARDQKRPLENPDAP